MKEYTIPCELAVSVTIKANSPEEAYKKFLAASDGYLLKRSTFNEVIRDNVEIDTILQNE